MSNLGGIAALVTAIASLAGLVTFFVSRHDKAKDPIPKQAAEVAMAKEALGIVKDSRDTLVEDVARLGQRVEDVEGEAHALRGEVQALRREVESIRNRWAAWYRDLTDRWSTHREQAAPPLPPTAD